VRLVLVQDGGLSYDDAEDGVTCILLFYHRRTGDYPWKETKPDVLLLRTLCHDYASAYWRKQKRRERLLDGWMPPSPEGSGHLEAIAIGELCAVDINDAFPTSARVMQNYGAYIPFNMPSLSNYSLRVRATDNTDGFTDVAEKRMRVHFPIEGWQRHWTRLHPLPECPSYPYNYQPDWTFGGLHRTEVPTGVERTFTVTESRTISNTGIIGTEAGLQVGTDEAKVAFKTYENIETGVSYNVSCSATLKYTMYPGFRYYEFWAYQWEEKAGVCQIYGANGYQGEARWWAAEYLRLLSNFLSIRLYVRVVPVSEP